MQTKLSTKQFESEFYFFGWIRKKNAQLVLTELAATNKLSFLYRDSNLGFFVYARPRNFYADDFNREKELGHRKVENEVFKETFIITFLM